jgi:hypothetical protein
MSTGGAFFHLLEQAKAGEIGDPLPPAFILHVLLDKLVLFGCASEPNFQLELPP